MVVDTDPKRIGVKSQEGVVGRSRCTCESSVARRRPFEAAQATEQALDATTNLEGGHHKRKEVSPKRIFVLSLSSPSEINLTGFLFRLARLCFWGIWGTCPRRNQGGS